jgi:hypothetical protein
VETRGSLLFTALSVGTCMECLQRRYSLLHHLFYQGRFLGHNRKPEEQGSPRGHLKNRKIGKIGGKMKQSCRKNIELATVSLWDYLHIHSRARRTGLIYGTANGRGSSGYYQKPNGVAARVRMNEKCSMAFCMSSRRGVAGKTYLMILRPLIKRVTDAYSTINVVGCGSAFWANCSKRLTVGGCLILRTLTMTPA